MADEKTVFGKTSSVQLGATMAEVPDDVKQQAAATWANRNQAATEKTANINQPTPDIGDNRTADSYQNPQHQQRAIATMEAKNKEYADQQQTQTQDQTQKK